MINDHGFPLYVDNLSKRKATHLVEGNAGLISPTSCNIPDCVATSTQEHQWKIIPDHDTLIG